jgi:polyisoprenoid-binding protein YceI
MKKYILLCVLVSLTNHIFCQAKWQIDNANSNLTFAIQWRQHSFRTGEFKVFSGDMKCKKDNSYEDAEIDFNVDATSLDLIASKLSNIVEDDQFLDSRHFPNISFKSSSVKKKHKNIYEIKGSLTIKGVSRDVVFLMEDKGVVEYEGIKYGALKVTGNLNKSDFKIFGGGEVLGNLVVVTGYFEIVKVNEK